jgi:hypothetical protein
VRLFAQYCAECRESDDNSPASTTSGNTSSESTDRDATAARDSKDWIGRTKVFVRCDNLHELKLPKFLHTYNAKPALIRESGCLIRYTLISCAT